MKMKKIRMAAAVAAISVAMTGCGRVVGSTSESAQEVLAPGGIENSTENMIQTEAVVTTAATEVTTTAATAATEPASTIPPVVQNTEIYKDFTFTDSHNRFLADTVFVGDSICSGLRVYGVLPDSSVVAKGSVSANNIFTFNFSVNGYEVPIIDALKAVNPKYVVFSMGMNDVNMTSSEGFVENYTKLLTQAQEALPDSKLIVASITPLASTSNFCSNSQIDSYNAALKASLESSGKWYYADVSTELKDSYNNLKEGYNGGDGIHLSGSAYYAYLYQVCTTAVDGGIYQP